MQRQRQSEVIIKWYERALHGIYIVPGVLMLFIVNLTPLTFLFPQPRTWLYETLLKSRVFALSGDRSPGRISFGLRLWDRINAYSIFIAAFLVPILLGLIAWILFDLSELWSSADPASTDKASVAQILGAALVGGVAVDVFLLTQLPQLFRPRICACFLERNPGMEDHIQGYFEKYNKEEAIPRDRTVCLHFIITNTGTSHLTKQAVRIELPPELMVAMGAPHGTRLSGTNKIPNDKDGQRVYFPPRDDPLDNAPGASALYHLRVIPANVQPAMVYELVLRIASERTNGFTEKRLRLKIL